MKELKTRKNPLVGVTCDSRERWIMIRGKDESQPGTRGSGSERKGQHSPPRPRGGGERGGNVCY